MIVSVAVPTHSCGRNAFLLEQTVTEPGCERSPPKRCRTAIVQFVVVDTTSAVTAKSCIAESGRRTPLRLIEAHSTDRISMSDCIAYCTVLGSWSRGGTHSKR